jgi:hypothetical protein
MARKTIASPVMVWILLILQFVPLVLFPPKLFVPTSQVWWLPVLCALMALVGALQLTVRRSVLLWPWYILSFAHGLNIISRLMMLMPRATINVKGTLKMDGLYLILTVAAMLLSSFFLWYFEQHEVRMSFLKKGEAKTV